MIIGLTGKIASGKNFIASLIEKKGYRVLDLDIMAQDSYKVLSERIVEQFGTDDRKELASIVFSDPVKRQELEGLIYPYLTQQILEEEKNSDKPLFINGALLHRASMDTISKAIIYVEASEETRRNRAYERNGMSAEDFKTRDLAQLDVAPENTQYACRVFTLNNENNPSLEEDLDKILSRVLTSMDLQELKEPESSEPVSDIKAKKSIKAKLICLAVLLILGGLLYSYFYISARIKSLTIPDLKITQEASGLEKKEGKLKKPSQVVFPSYVTYTDTKAPSDETEQTNTMSESEYEWERKIRRNEEKNKLPGRLRSIVLQF